VSSSEAEERWLIVPDGTGLCEPVSPDVEAMLIVRPRLGHTLPFKQSVPSRYCAWLRELEIVLGKKKTGERNGQRGEPLSSKEKK
jgi:hypothetical protein